MIKTERGRCKREKNDVQKISLGESHPGKFGKSFIMKALNWPNRSQDHQEGMDKRERLPSDLELVRTCWNCHGKI